MKDLLKVQIEVKDHNEDLFSFNGYLIDKKLCTVLTEVEKEEPKVWVPQVGEWAKVLGIGHTEMNQHFPKGSVFEISKVEHVEGFKYSISVKKPSTITGDRTNSIDCRKALPHEIPAPEPKGYCIKRTPENAEVLNKWANETEFSNGYVFYTNKDGYAYSKKVKGNYISEFIPEGFTELFTVESFFEKVGYVPEREFKLINIKDCDINYFDGTIKVYE